MPEKKGVNKSETECICLLLTTVITVIVMMQLHLYGTLCFPEHLYTSSHLNLSVTEIEHIFISQPKNLLSGEAEWQGQSRSRWLIGG